LPIGVRALPAISILLLLGFSAVILARAGLAFAHLNEYAHTLSWVVVGYCVLGCLANAATQSKRERSIWMPVVSCMLVTSSIVAMA
jgi:hypothetical protein